MTDAIRPQNGYCHIRPDAQFAECEGGIWIPQTGRIVKAKTGVCIAYTPYQEGKCYHIWSHKLRKRVLQRAAMFNDIYLGMAGKHCVYETGVQFQHGENIIVNVRLEHVAMISDHALKIGLQEIERCPKCKSKGGEHNMLLDEAGYCCQCGYNLKGEHKSQRRITVDSDEVEALGKTASEYAEERMSNRPKAKPDRVFSYPGQDKRA